MDFGAIIGVVVGMILIFSLLSIIVTQINSLISIILKTRASHLRDGIASLITDQNVQAQVLRHPLLGIVTDKKQSAALRLIGALTGSRKREEQATQAQTQAAVQAAEQGQNPGTLQSPKLSGVTWVNPTIFTDALFDTLLNNARDRFYRKLDLTIVPLRENDEKKNIREKINAYKIGAITPQELEIDASCLENKDVGNALKAAIAEIEPNRAAFEQDLKARDLDNVLQGVSQVSDPSTRRALQTLVSSAQTIEGAQKKVEQWFNARMDQVSDGYKRHISVYTLLIGFVIAAILNADAIHLASSLYTAPVVRESVQQVAAAFTSQQAADGTTQAATQGSESVDVVAAQAANAISQIASLNLPIGWVFNDAQCNIAPPSAPPAGVIISTLVPTPTATIDPNATQEADAATQEAVVLLPDGSALSAGAQAGEAEATETPSDDTGGTGEDAGAPVSNLVIESSPCDDRRNLALLIPFVSNSFKFEFFFLKVLGLALTMFAIGQGAPFWFDLLNRIVRGGGGGSAPQPNNVNVTVNNPPNGNNNPPIPPGGGGAG
jgi:hypothetical protein